MTEAVVCSLRQMGAPLVRSLRVSVQGGHVLAVHVEPQGEAWVLVCGRDLQALPRGSRPSLVPLPLGEPRDALDAQLEAEGDAAAREAEAARRLLELAVDMELPFE